MNTSQFRFWGINAVLIFAVVLLGGLSRAPVAFAAQGSGTITVNTESIPATDTGTFNMQIDGQSVAAGSNLGNGGTTGAVTVLAGEHVITQTAGDGTNISSYTVVISGDCSADGTIDVGVGQNAVCTITDIYKGNQSTGASLTLIPNIGTLYLGNPLIQAGAVFPAGNQVCSVQGTIVLNNLSCQNVAVAPQLGVQTMPTCQSLNFAVTIPNCTTNDTVLFAVGADPEATGTGSVQLSNVVIQGVENPVTAQVSNGNYTIANTPEPASIAISNPTTTSTPAHVATTPAQSSPAMGNVPPSGSTATTTPQTGAGAGLVNNAGNTSGNNGWNGFLSWLGENFWWLALLIIILLLLFWIFARDDDDDENNKQNQNQNTNQNQQIPPNNQQQS